ncbi:hypothetical protein [Bacillus sp. FJAT-28004]|uniref:hypothetical protein n=1 Tax=Bacillus sp. FJAT-28004 TaxID=1679165 RepID=UPI0006B4A807|nr:hypothetical protein [Bacillus sp. FJAT-28004]
MNCNPKDRHFKKSARLSGFCVLIKNKSEFKLHAVEAYKSGRTPMQIFVEAGFEIAVIGKKNPYKCLERWKKFY